MKNKILFVLALAAFTAAGCGRQNQTQNPDTTPQNQTQFSQSKRADEQSQKPQSQPEQPNQEKKKTGNAPGQTPQYSGEPGIDNPVQPEVRQVDMTASGFSPATITIKKGDYIQFVNKDSDTHWPASNPHPVHDGYPGFDAKKALRQNEKYRFQFTRTGTWGYHDHLNPSKSGTVIVE